MVVAEALYVRVRSLELFAKQKHTVRAVAEHDPDGR